MGHQNREAMAHGGVRVESTVRLGREVEGFDIELAYGFDVAFLALISASLVAL